MSVDDGRFDLYIFGACPTGTLFGVAAFIENNTDIIWAMLDKSGTVYTRRPNLDAVWGDALDKPVFVLRGGGGLMGIWRRRNRCNYIGNEDVAMFHIPGGHILSPQAAEADMAQAKQVLKKRAARLPWEHIERLQKAAGAGGRGQLLTLDTPHCRWWL